MSSITKRFLNIALLFVAVLLLASCATGRVYQKVDKIPDGMGVVYIYRTSGYGRLVLPEVNANEAAITKLITGGYYPYFSKPGEVEFSAKTETKSSVTLYIKAGQTYYIRGSIVSGAFIGRPLLTLVSPKVGEKEIADCKLQEGRQLALDEKINKTDTSAITPEEILLLKKSGLSDEKILEMQKKGERVPLPKINPFDWNEDGKKDIIIGSDSGKVYVYLNKGTNQDPVFDAAIEISNVKVEDGVSAPYVVDWNDDGKKDILAGASPGEVSIFISRGTNQQPSFAEERKINGGDLDVGDYSSPAMVDWDGDGLKDLVVGGKNGKVFLFLNIGYEHNPVFSSDEIKTGIKVNGRATPFIVDWNNDGKFDVVSGSSDGKVYIFINEGDNKNPKFSKPQIVQVNGKELKLPNSTSVVALDWDDDGKTDLLVSNKEKNQLGMYLLLNTGTKEKPEFKELKQIKGKFQG